MTSQPRRSLRRLFLLLLVPFALATCGTSIQKIPIDHIGGSGEKPLALEGGEKITFAVYVSTAKHSTSNYLLLDVEMLKSGKVVGTHACRGFEFEGAGGGCGLKHYNSECETKVPSGGIDKVRVTTKLEHDPGSASVEGLEIDVRKL